MTGERGSFDTKKLESSKPDTNRPAKKELPETEFTYGTVLNWFVGTSRENIQKYPKKIKTRLPTTEQIREAINKKMLPPMEEFIKYTGLSLTQFRRMLKAKVESRQISI
ncbi:MAG: hypothetical protein AAB410_00890 [Patescibacteria group bacterium]